MAEVFSVQEVHDFSPGEKFVDQETGEEVQAYVVECPYCRRENTIAPGGPDTSNDCCEHFVHPWHVQEDGPECFLFTDGDPVSVLAHRLREEYGFFHMEPMIPEDVIYGDGDEYNGENG